MQQYVASMPMFMDLTIMNKDALFILSTKEEVVVKTYLNSTRFFPLFTLRTWVQIYIYFFFSQFFSIYDFFFWGLFFDSLYERMRARNYTMFKFFQVKVG